MILLWTPSSGETREGKTWHSYKFKSTTAFYLPTAIDKMKKDNGLQRAG